jgi:release factor glutamine methyltransferase
MTLPTLMELVRKSTDYLLKHGITNARRETEWIFAETLKLTRMELYTRFDMPLDEAETARLRSLVQRRGRREPLAYVLGNQQFMDLTLSVGPGVLVPRPETEELVTLVLKHLGESPHARVVDIGTGSGAIALALKKQRPAWNISATDISHDALNQARKNALDLQLAIHFMHGDGTHPLTNTFDIVTANLPYIKEDERALCDPELQCEPELALFAGADGLTVIRPVMQDLPRILAKNGQAFFEHGFAQGDALRELVASVGLRCEVHCDGAGKERITRVWHAA